MNNRGIYTRWWQGRMTGYGYISTSELPSQHVRNGPSSRHSVRMSGFLLFSSELPLSPEVPGSVSKRGDLTQPGHSGSPALRMPCQSSSTFLA